MNERMINLETMSGDAWIDLREVVAVVCHLPNRENFNVDIHVSGGSIFTVRDTDKDTYDGIVEQWKMQKDRVPDVNVHCEGLEFLGFGSKEFLDVVVR
jgi:23S rRNA G2445 N2-methylase RlmL